MKEIECPECGSKMILRDSKYGLFYGCSRYPECQATHGAHQNSGKPLGTPADKETREWRVKAHDVFDVYWKKWDYKRKEAYRLLQSIMKLDSKDAHIGKFDKGQCQLLIERLKKQNVR